MDSNKKIVRYLKGTVEWKLKLFGEPKKGIEAYSDADWAEDRSTRKSVTGSIIFYSGGAINWISETCQEIKWLKRKHETETIAHVYEDNQSCISFSETGKQTKRSKHIDTRESYIRELCTNKEIILKYCPTNNMKADIFTKPFGVAKHKVMLISLNFDID